MWKIIEGMIDIFKWVNMKVDRITCTRYVLIVLISILLHVLCEAKVDPVFKLSLGVESTKCKKWQLMLL